MTEREVKFYVCRVDQEKKRVGAILVSFSLAFSAVGLISDNNKV